MPTVGSLPAATEVSPGDLLPISQVGENGAVLRSVTAALLSAGGSGAVQSVVGETGEVTAQQISTAIAGTGLEVVNGQLEVTSVGGVSSVVGQTGVVTAAQISAAVSGTGTTVSGGQITVTFPVTSVVGSTGAVTAAEISTAVAGSGLTVVGGQLTVSGSTTLATYTRVASSTSTQALAFSGVPGEIAVYDVTLAQATAFQVPTGAVSTGLQQIILWMREPASGSTFTPTFPATGGVVQYPIINGTPTPPPVNTSLGAVTRHLIETVDGATTVLWGV